MDFIQTDCCFSSESTHYAQIAVARDVCDPSAAPKAQSAREAGFLAASLEDAIVKVRKGADFAVFDLKMPVFVQEALSKTRVTMSGQFDFTSDTPDRALQSFMSVSKLGPTFPAAVQWFYDTNDPVINRQFELDRNLFSLTRIIAQSEDNDTKYGWFHTDPFRATRVMFTLKGEGTEFCALNKNDPIAFSEAKYQSLEAQLIVAPGFKDYGLGVVKPENLTDAMRHEATEVTRDLCDPTKGHVHVKVSEGQGVVFKVDRALHRGPLGYEGERLISTVEVLTHLN